MYKVNNTIIDGQTPLGIVREMYKGGKIFEGQYMDDSQWGRMIMPDGSYYIGSLSFNYFEGQGKKVSQDGQVVEEGMWETGKFKGKTEGGEE